MIDTINSKYFMSLKIEVTTCVDLYKSRLQVVFYLNRLINDRRNHFKTVVVLWKLNLQHMQIWIETDYVKYLSIDLCKYYL